MDLKRASYTYEIIPSKMGDVGIVRRADEGRSPICRILLPEAGRPMPEKIAGFFPDAVPGNENQDEMARQLREFLRGNAVDFCLENLDLGSVHGFAKRVLLADSAIPRGRVMTYGCLAASVGVVDGARAVGNVMAGNPFPLVIPCHRVVRSDGSLGGFGGGAEMKKALLVMEGVAFDAKGRVLPKHLFPSRIGP